MKATPIEIAWDSRFSIYASEQFLKTVGDEYGWLGGIDRTGTIRCVLPFTIIHKPFFRLVRFRVETIPLDGELTLSEERLFLNSVIEYFGSIGADMIIPPTTNTLFRTYPDGAEAAPYGSYIVDLTQPEDTIWKQLSESHRRKVRLATKSGVQIKTGPDYLEAVFRLVRDTFKRSKLGFMNYPAFERQMLGLGEYVRVWIAEHHGAIQAGMVTPFSQHSAYYVYGGGILSPASGATNLMHWEAIRFFKQQAVKSYDFVGARIRPDAESKQAGLAEFKQRFGGRLAEGYLWKYSYSPMKYLLYNVAAKFSRGGDIIDQEQRRLGLNSVTAPCGQLSATQADPIGHPIK